MESIFSGKSELAKLWFDALLCVLGMNELASLSLTCKYCEFSVLAYINVPAGIMDTLVHTDLKEQALQFYVLMGRMTVPQQRRWRTLPICTNPDFPMFSYFIACLIGGRTYNDAAFLASERPEAQNWKREQRLAFCSCVDLDLHKVIEAWKRDTLSLMIVTNRGLECPDAVHFEFSTRYGVVSIYNESNGDNVRVIMRRKCMFYAYRSEWIVQR